MAPQYGFDFVDAQIEETEKLKIAESLVDHLKTVGMKSTFDLNESSLVLTSNLLDTTNPPSTADRRERASAGITISTINDHHSGCHCPEGVVILIDPSAELLSSFIERADGERTLNYLTVGSIIEEYLIKQSGLMAAQSD